jgi:hypothetical protein
MKQYKIQNRSQKNSHSCLPLSNRWAGPEPLRIKGKMGKQGAKIYVIY